MLTVIDALAQTYDFVVLSTAKPADALGLASMFDKILLRDADPMAPSLFDELSRDHKDVQLIEDADDLAAA